MLTEEIHSAGVADTKVTGHEEAAHEKRNWVRLTYDCNNRCIFCLDSDTHDGEMRDANEVKQQILDGRRKGATRLILSGGEPTMHPRYVDFIKLGSLAGYTKIQTVTNGRMFQYPPFVEQCLDAGLSEITFSLHGPNAKIHDALVGVKGAFEQEVAGLKLALEYWAKTGRPIVNVDIVINRGNVKQLPEMLRTFYGLGVREFDLLQVVPFGRAYTEGRETLFYDLEEMQPYIREALEFSRQPDVHVWMNRFPPAHLEGFEHLIQDPYKLNDEVRGRSPEFARLLDEGTPLDCRDPGGRCRYCYLEKLCNTLEDVRATVANAAFDVVRLDTELEVSLPPTFGGDPASTRRARFHLPLVDGARRGARPLDEYLSVPALANAAGARALWLRAPTLARAVAEAAQFDAIEELELELDDYEGFDPATARVANKRVVRAVAATSAHLDTLARASFEIVALINRDTAAWIASHDLPPRFAVRQPTYERLTEAAERDVPDLAAFCASLPAHVAIENVPACIAGRAPRERPRTFDAAMATPEARLEIFRYTRRYILDHYTTKSLRCRPCTELDRCRGMHVNYVRAHGYGEMKPLTSAAAAE